MPSWSYTQHIIQPLSTWCKVTETHFMFTLSFFPLDQSYTLVFTIPNIGSGGYLIYEEEWGDFGYAT